MDGAALNLKIVEKFSPRVTPALVLVHLRTPLPGYLVASLSRLTKQFSTDIVLVTDAKRLHLPGVKVVHPRELGGDGWDLPLGLLRFDMRRHLWGTSFLRLIAVARLAELLNVPIIHLESDVVILWPEGLLAWGCCQPSVAYPLIGGELGIASTLMIRNADAASEFLNRLHSIADSMEESSEMDYLGRLHQQWPDVVALPRIPGALEGHHQDPDLRLNLRSEALARGIKPEALRNALFDGAALGISICGVDATHTRGIVRTWTGVHRDAVVPDDLVFSVEGDASDTRLLVHDPMRPDLTGRVVTLHCNSKEAKLFRSDGAALYRRIKAFDRGPRAVGLSLPAVRELASLKLRAASRRILG